MLWALPYEFKASLPSTLHINKFNVFCTELSVRELLCIQLKLKGKSGEGKTVVCRHGLSVLN